MNDFVQSINVTIMGMGLVFVSLGLLMVIILVLQRILRERPVAPAMTSAPSTAPFRLDPDPAPSAGEPAIPDEVVAAITVALAAWKQRQATASPRPTTVVTFAPGTPAWRALGRLS